MNNGIREFSTFVNPRLGMCDGNWHRITGTIDMNSLDKHYTVVAQGSIEPAYPHEHSKVPTAMYDISRTQRSYGLLAGLQIKQST